MGIIGKIARPSWRTSKLMLPTHRVIPQVIGIIKARYFAKRRLPLFCRRRAQILITSFTSRTCAEPE